LSAARLRTAVLISGRGSNMRALVADAKDPGHPAEIVLVAANDPACDGLKWAKGEGIAVAGIDHRIYGSREDFERALHLTLEIHRIDLICLAGFMRMLTPWFVNTWAGRMINIHPSLLPSYRGLHTHARALADGVKIHGCTVHYVVPAMDEGPIIAQAAVPVLDDDTPASLGDRVLVQEHRLYPLALRLAAGGTMTIEGNRTRTRGDGRALGDTALVVPAP
jgi:phosphoribosylglycinamide formyltransferase-1